MTVRHSRAVKSVDQTNKGDTVRTSGTVHILEMGHTSEREIGITLHILESANLAVLSQDT